MTVRVVRLNCEITEVRRNGGIPIRIAHAVAGPSPRMIVPRHAVQISSISGGIYGSVVAAVVEDLGTEVIVDVPHGGESQRRLRVPMTIVQREMDDPLGNPALRT